MTKRTVFICISLTALALIVTALIFMRIQRSSFYRIRFGTSEERVKAVRELADKPKSSAVDPLLRALKDSDPRVRAEAVKALAQFRAHEALIPCRSIIQEDRVPAVRAVSAAFLGEVHAPENIPVLMTALTDANEHVRASAAASLGKLHAQNASDALIAGLQDKAETVRHASVTALAALKCKKAIPVLITCLEREEELPLSLIQQALTAITGENRGIDAHAWKEWYENNSSLRP